MSLSQVNKMKREKKAIREEHYGGFTPILMAFVSKLLLKSSLKSNDIQIEIEMT